MKRGGPYTNPHAPRQMLSVHQTLPHAVSLSLPTASPYRITASAEGRGWVPGSGAGGGGGEREREREEGGGREEGGRQEGGKQTGNVRLLFQIHHLLIHALGRNVFMNLLQGLRRHLRARCPRSVLHACCTCVAWQLPSLNGEQEVEGEGEKAGKGGQGRKGSGVEER